MRFINRNFNNSISSSYIFYLFFCLSTCWNTW